MEQNNENHALSWKGSVIFGLIDLALVFLCTKLCVIMLSATLILVIICGISVSAKNFKETWKEGNHGAAFLEVIGLLLHVIALVLYVITVLGVFLRPIIQMIG